MFFGEYEYSRTKLRECVTMSKGIEAVSINRCVVFLQPEESGFRVPRLLHQTYMTFKYGRRT